MASEHSSQPHLPPAWAETPEPPPAWANDPLGLGGTGPRLPLPPEEPPAGNTSWKASVPGNGSWQQAFETLAATQGGAPGPQGGDGPRQDAQPRESLGTWPPAPAAPVAENGGWGTAPDPFTQADPFARPDPLTQADPFARPGPSVQADPFARTDPPAQVDPFARTATFGAPASPDAAPRDNGGQPGGNGHSHPADFHPGHSHPADSHPGHSHPGNELPGGPYGSAQQGLVHPGGPGQGHPQPPQPAPNGHASAHPGGPQQGYPQQGQPQQGQPVPPGGHLSRDPSDPNRPFVTAGQISGPKTPPPERQQELWNTVFGDNYQAIGDDDGFDEPGKPVWVFALAGSAVIALVGVLLWAFLAGPLASAEESDPAAGTKPAATPKASSKPKKKIGRLPRYEGDASPVAGTVTDAGTALTVARLGAPWRQDTRPAVPTTYGFNTRQYAPAGQDSTGKNQYAQVMSGPLSPRLKKYYTSPENLAPVINAVANSARNKFFPEDNKASKTAQQTLSIGGLPAQLAAYEVTSGTDRTTVVVAAVSTGADLPAIVYMSVPDSAKELLPDVNTVFKSIKTTTG
ncbi:hypothetical protein HS041_22650 [Planomonospora sp. ID67723]|uniref:hypothetical protein n=1 Tax=Planomonospora sp. ID67723 TaxID=2738134 RepID=UPI0018C41020|nr:hypothetical protein [Planomonospora sp. ID67723]MBG0830566.1 hypothetical protein [Planomonospora sp. ID67723]